MPLAGRLEPTAARPGEAGRAVCQPRIEARVCVHGRCVWAGCQACVEVCPRSAVRLEKGGPILLPGQCDGCGLCVAVCPTRAVSGIALRPAWRVLSGRAVGFAACAQVRPADGEGTVPCLHALGLTDLLEAWRQGCGNWVVAQAPCDACPRGQGERLHARIEHLNALLRERGRAPIGLKALPPARWSSLLQALEVPAEVDPGRRRYLGLAARHGPVAGSEVSSPGEGCVGPGVYLSDVGRLPWCIEIDPASCQACHACARICPSGAIVHEPRAEKPADPAKAQTDAAYRLEHARCSGCGLCADVCPNQAVRLRAWDRPRQWRLALQEAACARCGVPFAWPVGRTPAPRLCPVCARGQHKGRLYQVMDAA